MISIIVCSIDNSLVDELEKSVKETIGVRYELIVYKNGKEKKGISEVYNLCAQKAIYDILCFVHEDVVFDSKNWGKEIVHILERNKTGVVGVAGGKIITRNFISWGDNPDLDRYNYWQYNNGVVEHNYNNPEKEKYSEVVTLDGVLLVTKKKVWEKVKFDSDKLKGFHLYDADFCLNVVLTFHYKNFVCHTIKIVHKSPGKGTSKEYYNSLMVFHRKWKRKLPFCIAGGCNYHWRKKLLVEIGNALFLIDKFNTIYGRSYSIRYFILHNSLFVNCILLGKFLKSIIIISNVKD